MVVFKRKQVIVLSLVVMIIIAAYLQYSYKKSSEGMAEADKGRIGEAVYVDNEETGLITNYYGDNLTEFVSELEAFNESEDDFFAQSKLDREITRSRDQDSLKSITEDDNAQSEIKAQAYESMLMLIANSDMEMRLETIIKEKGFNDVLALFGNDGSIDIIVKSKSLTSAQVAQIADIVSRHADIDMSMIHIKNVQ